MNVQLHHVISDLTGLTGLAIVDAILAGERDPDKLVQLRDRRIKASADTIAKSLVGDYRPEHLFTLRQSLQVYRCYQQVVAACDREPSIRGLTRLSIHCHRARVLIRSPLETSLSSTCAATSIGSSVSI